MRPTMPCTPHNIGSTSWYIASSPPLAVSVSQAPYRTLIATKSSQCLCVLTTITISHLSELMLTRVMSFVFPQVFYTTMSHEARDPRHLKNGVLALLST